ncbi:MAG: HU family DNA-binding protein [Candidatus Aphodosoma sp.]
MSMDDGSLKSLLDDFASKANITKKEANAFLKSFQSVFIEALDKDKVLKINGLGSFKLTLVNERSSVDVNTGKPIKIDSHYKIVFTPETDLKNLVNAPFAHLDTIVIEDVVDKSDGEVNIDTLLLEESRNVTDSTIPTDNYSDKSESPLEKLTEQALEIKSLLADIQGVGCFADDNSNSENNENLQLEIIEQSPDVVESSESLSEETIVPAVPTQQEEFEKQEIFPESEKYISSQEKTPEIPSSSATPISDSSLIDAIRKEHKRKLRRRVAIICSIVGVVLLLSVALLLDFYYNGLVKQYLDTYHNDLVAENIDVNSKANEINDISGNSDETLIDETVSPEIICNEDDSNMAISVEESVTSNSIEQDPFSKLTNSPRVYTDFIDTIKMPQDSRLTLISLKYYGHRDFWVYIYEANKSRIQNPNIIVPGTTIYIPVLDKALIDSSNPKAIDYARYLHDQFVGKK